MKKLFYLFICIFSFYAKTIHAQSLTKSNFDLVIAIENGENDVLFNEKSTLFVGINRTDLQEIALFYFQKDSSIHIVSQIAFESEIANCNTIYAYLKEDLLILKCHFMRGIMYQTTFEVVDFKLKFIEETTYDLNESVYEEAEQAIFENDPLKYCQAYQKAQYYSDYPYRTIETLLWADSLATQMIAKNELKQASDLLFSIEVDCFFATHTEIAKEFPDDYLKVWLHAASIYFRAGDDVRCANLCNLLAYQFNENAAFFLQIGDVFNELKADAYAKKYYKNYVLLMEKEGKTNDVLARVRTYLK